MKRWLLIAALVAAAFFLGLLVGQRAHAKERDGAPAPAKVVPPKVVAGKAATGRGATTWVLHYRPSIVGTEVYDDLLAKLPAGDRVLLATSDGTERGILRRRPEHRAVEVLSVSRPLTPWARDRYILAQPHGDLVVLAPPPATIPHHQQGDTEIPGLLAARAPRPRPVHDARVPIGGDTILADRWVLVGHYSLAEAVKRTGRPPQAIVEAYGGMFARRAAVLPTDQLGIHRLHLDLCVAWAGGRRMLVSDPRLGMRLVGNTSFQHPTFGRFEAARNAKVARGTDIVAAELGRLGFAVQRVPTLVSEFGPEGRPPVVLSWTNAVVDGKTVYLPTYGVKVLDTEARRVWAAAGFKVKTIRCDQSILAGGAVRCLLNRVP